MVSRVLVEQCSQEAHAIPIGTTCVTSTRAIDSRNALSTLSGSNGLIETGVDVGEHDADGKQEFQE